MDKQRRQRRRVCQVRVEPYLATYARRKFPTDAVTGGLVIPVQYELHHAVWHAMECRPREKETAQEDFGGEKDTLLIHLPHHLGEAWQPVKDPAFWNYIPPRSQRGIERVLRKLFNWEFHHFMEEKPPLTTDKEWLRRFVRQYALGLDAEDTLQKNWQRYLRTMRTLLNLGNGKNKKNSTKIR